MNDTRELTQHDPVVVLAADEAFSMPLAVTVRSILDHLAPDRILQLYILDGGIAPETKERLIRSWAPSDRYRLQWIKVDESSLEGLETTGHVSVAAYYRILIPLVLPAEVERIIYLDSDLLVVSDLGPLWDCPLGDNISLCAQEFFAPYLDASKATSNFSRSHAFIAKRPIKNFEALGLAPDLPYFNSGVMAIDVQAWRRLKVAEAVIQCLHDNREYVMWWDQYALNIVLANKWGLLDPRWNQGSHIYKFPNWKFSHLDKATFQAALSHPYVVHFNSPEKPWHANNHHPWRKEFFRYLDRTDWAGWRPADDSSWSAWWSFQRIRLATAKENLKFRIRGRLRDMRDFVRAGKT